MTRDNLLNIHSATDQLSYFALTAGIMRAGFRAFPISPRNSERGVASLLQKMEVEYLIVSKDNAMQRVAKAACELVLLGGENDQENHERAAPLAVTLLDAPLFNDLYHHLNTVDGSMDLPLLRRISVDDVALILHSSGRLV
jgi:long-subunit acyl-CoA synthetase (AMP-forming)